MRRKSRVLLAALGVLAMAALVLPNHVGAQKVLNPGTFDLSATGGSLTIGSLFGVSLQPRPFPECSDAFDNDGDNQVDHPADPQCTSVEDNSELVAGFQPKVDVSIVGTVDGDGSIEIPTTGIQFPDAYVSIPLLFGASAQVRGYVEPLEPATGTIDPLTGAANLEIVGRIRIVPANGTGYVNGLPWGPNCSIGTAANPLRLNVITGTKPAVGSGGALTGAPYDPDTGAMVLVDNSFSIPGATGCVWNGGSINSFINAYGGLPLAPGESSVVIQALTTPALAKGVDAAITANTGGATAGAPITFSGADSTVAAPPATYAWEFSDGTSDSGVEVQKSFPAAGPAWARLTVTDVDGDSSQVTTEFTVGAGTTSTSTTTTTQPTTTTTESTTTTTQPTTTTTESTTTTTQPTTTTTESTTTTTESTTTTTQPTTTTTESTTTTTQPTTTTTESTTTTTQPPATDDTVTISVNGAVDYDNTGTGTGGVTVTEDSFGVRRVVGSLTIPGSAGGDAVASVDVTRAWILPLWTGQVSVRDQGAAVNLTAPVFGQIGAGDEPDSVEGTSNWFVLGDWPNLIRPYSLTWSVVDAD